MPIRLTPEDAFADPETFALRLADVAHRNHLTEMTVILDDTAAKLLGLPDRAPRSEKSAGNHPLLTAWNSGGWSVNKIEPWFSLYAFRRPAIHFGVGPWLGKNNNMLHTDDYQQLADRLATFHELTGVAFHGKISGIPGISLMKDYWPGVPKGRNPKEFPEPFWRPKWDGCTPARSDCEKSFASRKPDSFAPGIRLGFDASRQYLAAAHNTVLSPGALRHTRKTAWRKGMHGYWLITSPVWNIDGLPTGTKCWVAAPTMELIAELADAGYTVTPEIHDSWTNDQFTRELLRPWVAAIESAYQAALVLPKDSAVITNAVKGMYKTGVGLLHRDKSRVWRPDWHHAIIAKARCNMFRKMFAAWLYDGRVPIEIHYDAVWYYAQTLDDIPMRRQRGKIVEAFPVGDGHGQFHRTVIGV
jgi:hypothetical protein